MKTHEKYITEALPKKPYPKDLNIKDTALALTGEIESMISNLIKDWFDHDEFADMRTSDIKKAVNLAIKNIDIRKVM